MVSFKKLMALSTMAVLTLSVGTMTAFAQVQYTTPAEIAAALSGKTIEAVQSERISGKTYGTIAKEAGKLDEFKEEFAKMTKENLNAQVEKGLITRESADRIIAAVEGNQAICDGTGSARIGRNVGGLGANGIGRGLLGQGQVGGGRGIGGRGLRDGSCYIS